MGGVDILRLDRLHGRSASIPFLETPFQSVVKRRGILGFQLLKRIPVGGGGDVGTDVD
jgi:hypothetical protein